MKLLFLGTSAGAPTKQRNVTALALCEDKGKGWYLIDCGEATQHQILHTRLSLNSLKAILITHTHGDHCYGLPGLLASASMSGRSDPLTIIAPDGVRRWLEATREHAELYLTFDLHFLDSATLPQAEFGHLRVGTTPLSHRVPSYAYYFDKQMPARLDTVRLDADSIPRGPLWNRIQKGENVELEGHTVIAEHYLRREASPQRLVICGDNDTPALLTDVCQGADVLVHEATYTREVTQSMTENFGHSDAHTVATFAESVGVHNLILTHFSARYQAHPRAPHHIDEIRHEAASVFNGRLYLAEDLAAFELDGDGVLKPVPE